MFLHPVNPFVEIVLNLMEINLNIDSDHDIQSSSTNRLNDFKS